MPEHETSRLSRLVAILILLQSKRLLTASAIAKKFGISTRTVYRDMQALEEAGVPIISEAGKGYTLMEGYTLPPVMFSETEANALITAEQLILKNKDASLVKHYSEAITKIKAVLRTSTKHKADLLSERIHFWNNAQRETTSNHLAVIQLAITNYNVISITYRAENEEESARQIEPFALYSTNENWILIAFCRLRKEMRSFRLDRIQSLQVQAETFPPADFTLQQYFEAYKARYYSNP